MDLSFTFVVAQTYYFEKGDLTYLTIVPDSGGLLKVVVPGQVVDLEPGTLVRYNGKAKVFGKNGYLSLEGQSMRVSRDANRKEE